MTNENMSFDDFTLSLQCAVQRRGFSVCEIPTRQLSLQPVATGAIVEGTKRSKPPVERVVKRLGEHAGRNVSER